MDTTTRDKVYRRMCCCTGYLRNSIPIFGIIVDIVLITADQPYLVCEVLHTEEFSTHLHSFVIKREAKPVPIVFCQPHEMSDHHTLGLYSL